MKTVWPFIFFPGAQKEPAEEETFDPVVEELEEEDLLQEEEDSGDYEDAAFAFEVDLEEAARIEAARSRAQTKVVIGLSIVTACGLATGFALRAYMKNKKAKAL